jgi:hypothetical protein
MSYRATIDVSARYPSPVYGALSLSVRPLSYPGTDHEVAVGVFGGRLPPNASHNRKRPTREAGRFWGYYREERTANGRMAKREAARRAECGPVESG